MSRIAAAARRTYHLLSRGLLLLGSVATLAAVTVSPVFAEIAADRGHRVAAIRQDEPPATADRTFDALWATDLEIYLGIVVVPDEAGNPEGWVFYWDDEAEDWALFGTGAVKGDILSGELDEAVGGGTFRFTLTADGKGFDAVATSLWDWPEISFKGGLYAYWDELTSDAAH
jgi:hypothetical protein